jgi:transposase
MKITTMGIDLAKNVFEVHAVNSFGKTVLKKTVKRAKLMGFISNTPPCLIGIEACGSSHFWSRQFKKHGHTVKLIAPQYVKPYVKTNKNDANDAEGICEAVSRQNMHFVAEKTINQQDIQTIHRIRSRLIGSRTALCNEIRGLLAEYGVVISQGVYKLKKELPEILEDATNELTSLTREMILELKNELKDLEDRIEKVTNKLDAVFRNNDDCQRIEKIEGIGFLTATAIVAAVGDPRVFKNGRQMAAWLGLVPRQNSSGGKTRLSGISKRGDKYLRSLLIHGGRSVVRTAQNKSDPRSLWVNEKSLKRGKNKAAVAVANKNVRIIWKMLMTQEDYRSVA